MGAQIVGKELRIAAALALPDDVFMQAELIARVKALVADFATGLEALTEQPVPVTTTIVTVRPRGQRKLGQYEIELAERAKLRAAQWPPTAAAGK